MKVKIKNFTNIKNIDFEIIDSKLNFIYGISGSGKSSISTALTIETDKINEYTTFGSQDIANVNSDKKMEFEIFDDNAIKEYVFVKSGIGVYDVLFGENEVLINLKKDLNDFLSCNDVLDIRNVISKQKELISNIELELGISTTKTGSISKKGIYSTLSTPKTYTNFHSELNVKHKSWIKQGEEFIVENHCPFCSQDMSEVIVNRIKQIVNELPNDYQTVINASENLSKIGIVVNIEKINEEKTQVELKNKIDKEYKVLKELKEIEEVLNVSIHNDKSLEKKYKIKLSQDAIELFKKNSIDISSFLEKLEKDKEGYLTQKKKYNSILKTQIKGNITKINQYISEFGIKYKFEKTDYLSREVTYSLIHNDANNDTSDYLSTGEKNIIALILFLISHKNNNLIIDDPVSSYDDYRREQILKFIIKYRYQKQSNHFTTVILSHDQIFLKFLVKFLKCTYYQEIIGKVYHLENINGICRMLEIHSNDVDSLFSHIKSRCKEVTDYCQKVINLRLFYELQNQDGLEYKYLSAILHSNRDDLSESALSSFLEEKQSNEEAVIQKILDCTGINLPKYSKSMFSVDEDLLSKFELLCYVRDLVSESKDKDELNSVVHFNYSLFHILNPYKFNFQSERCYEILDDWLRNQCGV